MKKKIAAGLFAAMFMVVPVATAIADQPPGLLGYEGKPGNQGGGGGGGGGGGNGLLGYEGQPGNQGG